jgi:hypothetical protein
VDPDRKVDLAAISEAHVGLAGSSIHRDQIGILGADQQALHFAIGPVPEAPSNEAGLGVLAGLIPLRIVDPAGLAGRRIERGNQPQARDHVQHAVHHQRCFFGARRAQLRTGRLQRAIGVRLAPHHAQILNVVWGDLA